MEKIKLGSLYFDKRPVELGNEYDNQELHIGDTVSGQSINWVSWNGLLIADQCVCTNISWDQLNGVGYIFGSPVRIDGEFYLCRSLKVGSEKNVPNEWDTILDELGEEDSLWNWESRYFWGQEISAYGASYRAIRGYYSARGWHDNSASNRGVGVGFRPVLEPLSPEPLISDSLLGSKIRVFGNKGYITGILTEYSEYDLILELQMDNVLPNDAFWARQEGSIIIADRSQLTYIFTTAD